MDKRVACGVKDREIQLNVIIEDLQAGSWESVPCPFPVVYIRHYCAQ